MGDPSGNVPGSRPWAEPAGMSPDPEPPQWPQNPFPVPPPVHGSVATDQLPVEEEGWIF